MFLVLLVSLYPLEESQLQLVITKRIAWYVACYSVHSVSDRLSWIVSYLDWCRLHHTYCDPLCYALFAIKFGLRKYIYSITINVIIIVHVCI